MILMAYLEVCHCYLDMKVYLKKLANNLLDVVLHGDAAEGDGENAGHVEGLRYNLPTSILSKMFF
jgi:hypothetical protein